MFFFLITRMEFAIIYTRLFSLSSTDVGEIEICTFWWKWPQSIYKVDLIFSWFDFFRQGKMNFDDSVNSVNVGLRFFPFFFFFFQKQILSEKGDCDIWGKYPKGLVIRLLCKSHMVFTRWPLVVHLGFRNWVHLLLPERAVVSLSSQPCDWWRYFTRFVKAGQDL